MAKHEILAELRHDLRTPVNQVLGYTEMLIEDARELGSDDAAAELEQLHGEARRLLDNIQSFLSTDSISREQLHRLCEDLRTSVGQIITRCESLGARPPERGMPDWRHDLKRIHAAADNLIATIRGYVDGGGALPPEPALTEESAATHDSGGARLLVVDDNQANREMLARRLERQGYAVTVAQDGRQALHMIEHGPFDLVLLDMMMPVMDGFAVLEHMRKHPNLREVPVIVISALDEMEGVVRCIEMGAEDYLFKPFDPVLLRARIKASLEKSRLRSQLVVREKLASLGALTAGVAHELKNPLNFVTNFAQLSVDLVRELREKLGGLSEKLDQATRTALMELVSDLEQNVLKIQEHGARADNVIRSMLLHSQGYRGTPRLTDLNALLNEYVNLAYHGMRAQDPAFHATIETDFDFSLEPVSVMPQDISRVFLNVANNAFQAVRTASHSAPTVRVSTKDLGDRAQIRIRDNGPGIPPHLLDRVFDPFFTTKPVGEGTGLGLSLSYDIVAGEHKGEIHVESEEGGFTEFIITLPKRSPVMTGGS